ncbi:hypothetical protein IMG5_077690, partial [Ichthyophthirius multifiliis]
FIVQFLNNFLYFQIVTVLCFLFLLRKYICFLFYFLLFYSSVYIIVFYSFFILFSFKLVKIRLHFLKYFYFMYYLLYKKGYFISYIIFISSSKFLSEKNKKVGFLKKVRKMTFLISIKPSFSVMHIVKKLENLINLLNELLKNNQLWNILQLLFDCFCIIILFLICFVTIFPQFYIQEEDLWIKFLQVN